MLESFLPNIINHQVTEYCHWPPELYDIAALLQHRIPKLDRNGLSPYATEIYEDVTARLPSISTTEDDDQSVFREQISKVLDTVFVLVHLLRSRTMTTADQRKPTRTIWTSLFTTLALTCSKESLIMTDVPFLLPQTVTTSFEDTAFEGRAKILISSYVAPKGIESDVMDVDSVKEVIEEDSCTAESSPCFQMLDGPVDGHILPGSGRRTDCVLPVICVADQVNIHPLIVSAVCQRHTWGISLPVVGISIEDTGVLATVIIGWISDEDRILGSKLPPVHLASASGTAVKSSLGIFDLSDPLSALQFSYFILGLHSQFSDIVTNFGTQQRDVCWRRDHLRKTRYTDPHIVPMLDWRGRVQEWLKGVNSWDRDPIEPLELSAVPPADLINIIQTYAQDSGSSSESESQSSESQATGDGSTATSHLSDECKKESSAPRHYTYAEFAALKDTLDVRTISRSDISQLELISFDDQPASHYSASTFADLEGTLLDMRAGVVRWIWERRTLRVGFIKMDELQNEADTQLNEIIDLFTHTLELAWPDCWPKTAKDAVGISCDPIHRHLLESLFSQYEVYTLNQTESIPALPDDGFATLRSRLSIFLAAISDARQRRQQTSRVLNEAKIREPFDLLLNLFWCDEETDVSNLYFQDSVIRFASNKGVEGVLHDRTQAHLCDNILWTQSMSVDTPAVTTVMDKRSKEMSKWNLRTFRFPRPRRLDAAERNAEPTQGVADGLATIRARINFDCGSAAADVLLPLLVVKYQDMNSWHTTNAYRQCQMCCVSAVEFLASIGIAEFPVYGLVVSGSRVSIMMAWHSTKSMRPYMECKIDKTDVNGFNFLIDANLVSLDIAEPLDAYRFAIAIHRIYLAGRQLADILKGKNAEAIRKLERQFYCRDNGI